MGLCPFCSYSIVKQYGIWTNTPIFNSRAGDYVADHEIYGEQALGIWNRRVAFKDGVLPLEPNDECNGDFLYVQGSQASLVPDSAVTPTPVSTLAPK